MTEHKGLILHVMRPTYLGGVDCTRGGVSSKHDSLVLVGTQVHGEKGWTPLDRYSQVFSASEDAPAVVLVGSVSQVHGPHLVPLEYIENGPGAGNVGPMAGGNYAVSGDSRFAELGQLRFKAQRLDAVPIHDRVETNEQYRQLSSD